MIENQLRRSAQNQTCATVETTHKSVINKISSMFNLIKLKLEGANCILPVQLYISFNFPRSRRTIELTWGETEYTQVKGNKTTPNESRCFALTSNDLLGGALHFKNAFATVKCELAVCLRQPQLMRLVLKPLHSFAKL